MGFDTSSSASLPPPLKKNLNVYHTSSTSGVVLSLSNANHSHFSYKVKNGSKGKGKGKLQQQVQGELKLTEMGNKNQRENHELSLVNAGADPIKSHYDLGLVQTEPYGGMESHLSSNSQEQEKGVPALDRLGLAGMGKPLVAIPNGHSIKGGRKNPGVESIVSKFAGANFAKIKPSGGITVKENGRNTDLCNKFDGVFGSHHFSPNVWGKHSIQSPHNVQGSTDGDNGACNMFVEDRGVGQDQHEEFELEVAEPSKESTSSY